jgi:ATP-binding cassette subfamily B multidrug efflux pump
MELFAKDRAMEAVFNWFETRINPYPAVEPEQPPTSLIAFCLYFLRGAKRWLLLMSLTSICMALFEVATFSFIGGLVDWLANADPASFLASEGNTLLLIAVFLILVVPAMSLLNNATIGQMLLGNLPQRIRWVAHRYLLRQSIGYFENEFAGRVGAKLMQTALAVREVVMKVSDAVVYVGVYFLGAMALAAWSDWRLGAPFLCWLGVYSLLLRYYIPRLGKVAEEQANAHSTMMGRIVDSYSNIATVKLFSHTAQEEAYAKTAMHGFLTVVHRQMRLFSVLNVSIVLMNSLLLTSVTGLGIWLWVDGQMTPGSIAVSAALVIRLTGMSQWMMFEMSQLVENVGMVRDGMSSISLPSVVTDAPDAKVLPPVRGQVAFDDVSFHYGRSGGVIEGLSMRLAPGEKMGLIGPSGSGKTTIVNLLLRLHEPQTGTISIDDTDIASITQDSLRAQISVVTQDTSLFHRSIRENILYGKPGATEPEMIAAAKRAAAHDFIMAFEDSEGRRGYDAHVGERGAKLSGGQRQRILIARVLLKDAPIIVLDEATSALDSEAEAAIQEQLRSIMDGKTVIAIAHRLSTIALMDRLVVLDKGDVVEDGTHQDLLKRNGRYAQLWQRQLDGYLPGEPADTAA